MYFFFSFREETLTVLKLVESYTTLDYILNRTDSKFSKIQEATANHPTRPQSAREANPKPFRTLVGNGLLQIQYANWIDFNFTAIAYRTVQIGRIHDWKLINVTNLMHTERLDSPFTTIEFGTALLTTTHPPSTDWRASIKPSRRNQVKRIRADFYSLNHISCKTVAILGKFISIYRITSIMRCTFDMMPSPRMQQL